MNLYNYNYAYNSAQAERHFRREEEKKNIKTLGITAGIAIILYTVVQNILSVIIAITPLRGLYATDPMMQSVVTIFFTVFSLLIPFGACGFYLEKKLDADVFNFGKPVNNALMIWAVPFGFFVCLVGNYITTNFVNIMGMAGINLTAPEYNVPEDFSGRIIYAISIAVVPALVEEFAMRGVILQPLRKYGDKFAILASSIVFAVLHGNLIQAPFALIAGIAIGYAVCITNSIWTGVLIHFCNNLYAVLTEFMVADITDPAKLEKTYMISTVALYIISVVGSIIFVVIKNKRKIMPSFTVMTEKEKMKGFIWNAPMIIALIIMLFITKQYVSFS